MKKTRKLIVIIFVLFVINLLANYQVFASDTVDYLTKVEYSEEFKKWLELSDEEKESVLMPRMYDITNTETEYKNPLLKSKMLRTSLTTRFSLKEVIANNIIVKNQQDTASCWAFASLASLETNLAMLNYKNKVNTSKIYNFSERHMEYANTRTFANNQINEMGYNRKVGTGGGSYLASTYLTNGLGAVEESSMPFENNEKVIDISEINKTIASQVYDTREFPSYSSTDDKSAVKEHIQNYGSVYAGVYGGDEEEERDFFSEDCYNNETGAIYCNDDTYYEATHAVAIIGWDDNYSVENFNEASRPSSNGAWIIKNSWGEKRNIATKSEIKELLFNEFKKQGIEISWNTADEIPDEIVNEIVTKENWIIEDDIVYEKIGDNGIMYVSYEDVNITQNLWGIIKSADTTDYDNIYQYDIYHYLNKITWNTNEVMLCNIFEKQTTGTEYLTQVSIYVPGTYTCRVYVNPNGTSKAKSDLQLVSLKAGESETFDAGYHTLEFAKPIEIKSNSFTVVVEITTSSSEAKAAVLLESKIENNDDFKEWDVVSVEREKCFIAIGHDLENCQWGDLGELYNGDSTIKAFTTNTLNDESLKEIKITTPPTKTEYFEGDNFDTTGMIVTAYYNSKTKPSVVLDSSSYSISGGSNLKVGQTSVKITYEDMSVEQPITVEKNSVTELKIKTPPTKTEYNEGQNFDKTGMVIEVTFKDGTTKEVIDYTIINGNNLKANQTTVTISYGEKTVTQAITIIPNPLIEINVTKAPTKTKYVVGQDFDKTGMVVTGTYQDNSTQEILDYTIENGTNLTKEQTSVTIKYLEKTTTQKITVEEKSITGITINEKPSKTIYIQNKEELDLTGGSIKVTYNDGTNEIVPMTSKEIAITGFDNKELGKINLTITYQTKTVEFEVEIIKEAIEEKAENSNFDNAKGVVKQVKAYYFSDNSQKDYVLMEVEINSISRNLNNDKLEYYYYLSTNQNEKNITGWTKITEEQKDSNKIQFTIDSRNIANYNEISNENVLYIYIKEVAIKGGNQNVAISNAILLDSNVEIETYLDNAKVENASSGNDTTTDKKEDDTIAGGTIPNAGSKIFIIIAVVILTSAIGVICYKKYNLVKDIK